MDLEASTPLPPSRETTIIKTLYFLVADCFVVIGLIYSDFHQLLLRLIYLPHTEMLRTKWASHTCMCLCSCCIEHVRLNRLED